MTLPDWARRLQSGFATKGVCLMRMYGYCMARAVQRWYVFSCATVADKLRSAGSWRALVPPAWCMQPCPTRSAHCYRGAERLWVTWEGAPHRVSCMHGQGSTSGEKRVLPRSVAGQPVQLVHTVHSKREHAPLHEIKQTPPGLTCAGTALHTSVHARSKRIG